MTNDECLKNDEGRMSKEGGGDQLRHFDFVSAKGEIRRGELL
jgi:hypothetical protein